ncbi:MAG: AMP-binding protein [Elainellaceae cyanobacterium]
MRATQTPERTAVVLDDCAYAYGALLSEVQQVAAWAARLSEVGDRPQKSPLVALLSANRIEFLQVFLGTAAAGGVAMVLSPRWGLAQVQAVLGRWPPDGLVGEAARLGSLPPSVEIPSITALPSSVVPWRSQPSASSGRALKRDILTEAPADADRPFYICFTSGTTGQPKGIIKTHRSWLDGLAASRTEFGIGPTDRVLVPGELAHSLSLYTTVEVLSAGAALHLLHQATGRAAMAQFRQHAITVIVAVPTLLYQLASAAIAQDAAFPSVRLLVSGGAKLTDRIASAVAQAFPQARVVEYYGASELGFVSLRAGNAVPAASVGRPFKSVELSIQRQDGSGEANVDECGWVSVRSTMICSGYLTDALGASTDRPASGFRQVNGWWTVGDRGWRDAQGYLYLAGREEMLLCAGVNVDPAAVEAALLNLPEVVAAVVLGLSDDCRGDVIHAVVVWREVGLTRRSLRLQLRPYLSRHALPRRVYALPELPLTPSGKVARAHLTERLGRGELTPYEVR